MTKPITIKTKRTRGGFVQARFFIGGKPTKYWDIGMSEEEAEKSLRSRHQARVEEEAKDASR